MGGLLVSRVTVEFPPGCSLTTVQLFVSPDFMWLLKRMNLYHYTEELYNRPQTCDMAWWVVRIDRCHCPDTNRHFNQCWQSRSLSLRPMLWSFITFLGGKPEWPSCAPTLDTRNLPIIVAPQPLAIGWARRTGSSPAICQLGENVPKWLSGSWGTFRSPRSSTLLLCSFNFLGTWESVPPSMFPRTNPGSTAYLCSRFPAPDCPNLFHLCLVPQCI